MRLFLDTSVCLAACGSEAGASRQIVEAAEREAWELIVTPYVVAEVGRNLAKLPPVASRYWLAMSRQLLVYEDVLTLDKPTLFNISKDRPILFGALAWADVLLTLDRGDFGLLMGSSFYGLPILRPGDFLALRR